jgi:hypothetical protein
MVPIIATDYITKKERSRWRQKPHKSISSGRLTGLGEAHCTFGWGRTMTGYYSGIFLNSPEMSVIFMSTKCHLDMTHACLFPSHSPGLVKPDSSCSPSLTQTESTPDAPSSTTTPIRHIYVTCRSRSARPLRLLRNLFAASSNLPLQAAFEPSAPRPTLFV